MTTLNLQVNASANDATENDAFDTDTTGTQQDNLDTVDFWNGWRWTGASALAGATINTATCQFKISSSTTDEPQITFSVQALDNAPAFSAGAGNANISSRTRSGAVNWDNANLGVGASPEFKTSPSVVGLLNSSYLTSGVIVFVATTTSGNSARDFLCNTYDNAAADGAKLDVDYTVASITAGEIALLIHNTANAASAGAQIATHHGHGIVGY